MRRWTVQMAAVVLSLALGSSAFAQQKGGEGDSDQPDMRAKVIVDEASGVKVERPEGWVSGKNGKGVVAVFRAAGDDEAQIEVRVSPHVKKKQRDYFFASFHTNLQKAGFVKKDVREDAQYDGNKGLETEYETASKSKKFRLIVWQTHHGDSAVLVVGFFPAKTRDKYYPSFQAVITKLTYE